MLEFRVSFSFLNYLTKMPKTKKFESSSLKSVVDVFCLEL